MDRLTKANLIVDYIHHLQKENDQIILDVDYLPSIITDAKIVDDGEVLQITGRLSWIDKSTDDFRYAINKSEADDLDFDIYSNYDETYITRIFNKFKKMDDCSTNFNTFIKNRE